MIYINGRFLTQDLTGVQRFAIEISKRISSQRNDVVFLVPYSSEINFSKEFPDFKFIVLKGFDGHLWEQLTLPMFLVKNKKPLLINLCNTAPVFYKNQISTHHDVTYIK